MLDFQQELKRLQSQVEAYLAGQFQEEVPHKTLLEAMRYSLLAGGKRLRPIFCMAFCEASGGKAEDALRAGCAVEMVHTYSLIHDDLPCMDNDDYRRGRLTNHKVYGEAMATLAGDALLTAAFSFLASIQATPEQALACVAILAQAAGENGMVAGQVLDLDGETRQLTEQELRNVHRHKTGDMIRAACQMGAVLGGASKAQLEAAEEYALHLGMAFQIRDDMLDCIGSQEELGKPIGSDQENGKTTFVTLRGLEGCQSLVEEETGAAIAALEAGKFVRTDFLRNLALALTQRMK